MSPDYFSQDNFNLVCVHIRAGNSVRKFDFHAIGKSASGFYNWMDEHASPAQLEQYARAREAQADVIFDECLDIADNCTDDVIFLTVEDDSGESGKPAIKHTAIQRARLQIDTRMKMAGKLQPKKYGDKLQHGGDPENPVQHNHTGNVTLSPAEAYLLMLNGKS